MPILPFPPHKPIISPDAFIAPDAWLIGDVTIGARVSVFFGAVLRGDIEKIRIGAGTNIQEHVVVHTSHGMSEARIGSNVTVGHRAIVHGCSIGDTCLIGMGATVLDNAEIGELSIIGAHALIPKGMKVPARSLVMGTPGRVVRGITQEEERSLLVSAQKYQELAQEYRRVFPSASEG